jgi:uroporphyrinogen decarboxylase
MTTRTIEMNSRQRVQRALSHQEPDRVPMMMSASRWVVEQLKEHLGGIETDRQLMQTLRLDVWDTRGLDYESGIGARYVGPRHFAFSEDCAGNLFEFFNYHEEITANEFGPAYAMGPPSIGVHAYPTLADLEAFPWPRGDWFDFADVRRQLEPWAEDFAIAATGASVFQHPMLFRGIEQLSLEMAADPEIAHYIIGKVSDFYCGYFERLFEEAGDLIQIFRLADDIGAQNNLFVSPATLDEFVTPHVRRCAELAHRHDIKLMFHTDGNVLAAIPRLIDWGVDLLDPIQPEVPDMDVATLKREFGDQLSFSGGVGAQEILPRGSVQDVRAEVQRVIDILAPGGGYILAPGHPSLQMDVPTENIIAMFKAGLEYGTYPPSAAPNGDSEE